MTAKARLVTVTTSGEFVAFRGPMCLGQRRVWMAWCDDECGYTKGETNFRNEAIRWANEHNAGSHAEVTR